VPPSPAPPIAPQWPITPPADLPSFPGPGWEYDEPPSAGVVRRANEMLAVLYAPGKGLGSGAVDFIEGAWHGFKAERMRNGKNGVTAWRLRRGAVAPQAGPTRPVQPSPPAAPPFIPVSPPAPPGPSPAPPGGFTPVVVVVPRNPTAEAMSPRDVQDGLNQLGYGPLVVDGQIGPKTRAAISAFQRANPPLVVDGIVGPQTKSILMARLAALHGSSVVIPPAPPSPAPGSVNTVRDVQAALNTLGYGPLATDGINGPKTAAAVRSFQRARGLTVDGVAGPKTKAALASALQGMAA
jgi:peptidoglycan hydrolase-like protein with peptidoglycan-binding domain